MLSGSVQTRRRPGWCGAGALGLGRLRTAPAVSEADQSE